MREKSNNDFFKIPSRTNYSSKKSLYCRIPILDYFYPNKCRHTYIKKKSTSLRSESKI